MTERISLVEAYDNRDVIARLVRQQSDIDMMMNILQNIDPDGDLTNVVLRTGDQSIAGVKTFTGKIVADCDIIQNGAAYETHAEQIYAHNDYMVMRDGQLNGLPAGSYSGLQVKKYNGSDDVRMVVDNTGIMRVGDINDEKPLMVRDEAADLTDGDVLLWDGTNQKAIGQAKDATPTAGSNAPVTSDGIKSYVDTAVAAKGNPNTVTRESYTNVSIPAGGAGTSAKQITIPENGTYLVIGVVSSSTAMTSGLSVKGFAYNGSNSWISTNAATGDGQYASFMRVDTLTAGTTVDLMVYVSAVGITISGHIAAVKLV